MLNIVIIIFILMLVSLFMVWFMIIYFNRTIDKYTKIEKKYPIIISLTTSPTRISEIKPCLQSLIKQTVPNQVVLIIPERFRNTEEYNIPEWLKDYPVTIYRPKNDYGPVSKITGAIEYLKLIKKESYILYLDDDINYPERMIESINIHIKKYNDSTGKDPKKALFCTSIRSTKYHNNYAQRINYRYLNTPIIEQEEDNLIMPEAFGGIVVHNTIFNNDNFMKYIENITKNIDCKLSDDLIMAYYYKLNNIIINNIIDPYHEYYVDRIMVNRFEYSYGDDALCKGAGGITERDDDHSKKYDRCLKCIKDTHIF